MVQSQLSPTMASMAVGSVVYTPLCVHCRPALGWYRLSAVELKQKYHKVSGFLFVCLFNRVLHAETHLGPDGTRLEQNGFKTKFSDVTIWGGGGQRTEDLEISYKKISVDPELSDIFSET